MSRSARTRRDKRDPRPDFDDTTAAYGRFSFGGSLLPKQRCDIYNQQLRLFLSNAEITGG